MALVINTNVASLNAQKNLLRTEGQLNQAMQRLSSGLRINSAKDDAAGMFVVETQTADIRGLNQAIRNAGDGISLAQTAEGAMGQIQANFQRIRELAVQSANGTLDANQRTALQAEVTELANEIDRIIDVTEFNGTNLLGGTAGPLTFQVGQDNAATNQITVSLADLSAVATAATGIDISTSSGAQTAMDTVDTQLTAVSTSRATFGAVQNRFETVISNLTNYVENLTAARSRIQDADFAMETANLTKAQILQQAGISVLSQANVAPQSALALLQ